MDGKSLAETSADTIVASLTNGTKEILLCKLIKERSKNEKIALFESLGFELYGGVMMKDQYQITILSMCSGGDEFVKNVDTLQLFYSAMDYQFGGISTSQVLFATSGNDYDDSEENIDRFKGVKFDCARPFLGRTGIEDYDPIDLYGSQLYESPEARVVFDALYQQNPKIFKWPLLVIRSTNVSLFEDDGQWNVLSEQGEHGHLGIRGASKLANAAVKTEYCDNLEEEPETDDLEFSFLLNNRRWYAFLRNIHCESGG